MQELCYDHPGHLHYRLLLCSVHQIEFLSDYSAYFCVASTAAQKSMPCMCVCVGVNKACVCVTMHGKVLRNNAMAAVAPGPQEPEAAAEQLWKHQQHLLLRASRLQSFPPPPRRTESSSATLRGGALFPRESLTYFMRWTGIGTSPRTTLTTLFHKAAYSRSRRNPRNCGWCRPLTAMQLRLLCLQAFT